MLRNKEGRVDGIRKHFGELKEKGLMGFMDALSIRQKLAFSEGQVFGRIGAPVAHMLSK